MAGHPHGDEFGFAGQTFDVLVEAVDGLSADMDLAADRILDGGVVGEQVGDLLSGTATDEFQVAVDDGFDVFGSGCGHENRRYTRTPRASASSASPVTGRSHTRPRQT